MEDMEGFLEVFDGLSGEKLDIILHSPGGSPEATEALVNYIRSKFSDVRVFIPHAAMSAATMLACSGNRIVMGKQSSIGPIDPQMIVPSEQGYKSAPAQAILDQFELAKEQLKDPKLLPAWLPILGQYGPSLLVQCNEAIELSRELVKTWLTKYMFVGDDQAASKAEKVAKFLADHKMFKTHSRPINRDLARSYGLIIDDMEKDPKLEDLVLSVFHATSLTFNGTAAAKIVENHIHRAWVKQINVVLVPAPVQQPPAEPKK
jgi:hypothetical protein